MFHFLLACIVSEERSVIFLSMLPCFLWKLYHWFLSICIDVIYSFLCVYPAWRWLCFLDLWVDIFIKYGKISSHYFLKYFLCLPYCTTSLIFEAPIIQMLDCLILFHRSLILLIVNSPFSVPLDNFHFLFSNPLAFLL